MDNPTNSENFYSFSETINEKEKKYWLYAPGHNASKWDEFYSQGIMGIAWDEMGDLKMFSSKEAMKSKMKELYGYQKSYRNSAHATWQFANELQPGDIIYVKKGISKVIGRGTVISNYSYDASRAEYKHIHKVNWEKYGEWEHPGKAFIKTLTNITDYKDYIQKLEKIYH